MRDKSAFIYGTNPSRSGAMDSNCLVADPAIPTRVIASWLDSLVTPANSPATFPLDFLGYNFLGSRFLSSNFAFSARIRLRSIFVRRRVAIAPAPERWRNRPVAPGEAISPNLPFHAR